MMKEYLRMTNAQRSTGGQTVYALFLFRLWSDAASGTIPTSHPHNSVGVTLISSGSPSV